MERWYCRVAKCGFSMMARKRPASCPRCGFSRGEEVDAKIVETLKNKLAQEELRR